MNLKITVILLAVILMGLLAAVPFVNEAATATKPQIQAQPTTSASTTVPTATQPVTVPTTVPTEPVTIPATEPTVPPATAPAAPIYSDNPTANAFILARLDKWICPLKDPFEEVVGSRTFGSGRSNGTRAHAGLDFVAPHGTKVYAVTSGTVQRVAIFYQNTYAVEVKNDDGSILRYCEIATNLKAGDYVRQGDVIGTILRAEQGLTEMLHIEVYMGNVDGALTQTWNDTYSYVKNKAYQRRSDLIDPTFLKDLRQLS